VVAFAPDVGAPSSQDTRLTVCTRGKVTTFNTGPYKILAGQTVRVSLYPYVMDRGDGEITSAIKTDGVPDDYFRPATVPMITHDLTSIVKQIKTAATAIAEKIIIKLTKEIQDKINALADYNAAFNDRTASEPLNDLIRREMKDLFTKYYLDGEPTPIQYCAAFYVFEKIISNVMAQFLELLLNPENRRRIARDEDSKTPASFLRGNILTLNYFLRRITASMQQLVRIIGYNTETSTFLRDAHEQMTVCRITNMGDSFVETRDGINNVVVDFACTQWPLTFKYTQFLLTYCSMYSNELEMRQRAEFVRFAIGIALTTSNPAEQLDLLVGCVKLV
jgi:hypothetical protein